MKVIESNRMIKKLPKDCRKYGDYGVTDLWLKDMYENLRYWKEQAEGK